MNFVIAGPTLFFFGKNSPFSNHNIAPYVHNGMEFLCTEQDIMFNKACLFGDREAQRRIMNCTDPVQMKREGRAVKNFHKPTWELHMLPIATKAQFHKFTANQDRQEILTNTAFRELVEASGYDRDWGIGMFANDSNINNRDMWGRNICGKSLMFARQHIYQGTKP